MTMMGLARGGVARRTRGPDRRRWSAACLAAVMLVPAGCTGGGDGDGAGKVDEVTYLTGLGATGREGFVWVASAKGFFAEEHIRVTVRPGAAGDANLQVLAAGRAQFAAIDYSGAVVRAGTGNFDGIRCIAVLQAKTTIALMALESSGIRTPRDLLGRTVAQPAGAVTRTLFPAYARLAGLNAADAASVKWIEEQGPALPPLLAARRVDAIGQFVPAAPTVSAAAKGAPIKVLAYSDYMTDLYGEVVVTRTRTDPDLQRRFTRALIRGLVYAVAHPEEAGQIVHEAAPTTPADGAAAELRLLQPYVGSPQATPELVARSMALLQSVGMIPAPVPPDQVFDFAVAASAAPAHA